MLVTFSFRLLIITIIPAKTTNVIIPKLIIRQNRSCWSPMRLECMMCVFDHHTISQHAIKFLQYKFSMCLMRPLDKLIEGCRQRRRLAREREGAQGPSLSYRERSTKFVNAYREREKH
jgi:hypothetical protein